MALTTQVLATGSITTPTNGTEFSPQMIRDSTGHLQIVVNDLPSSFTLKVYGRADNGAFTGFAPVFEVTNATATPGVNGTDWEPSLSDGATLISPVFPLWPFMRVDIDAISGTGDFTCFLME